MKPTSIIFLLVSLVIILVGWLVCNSAEATAAADGIQIFDSAVDADKNAVNTVIFDTEEIYNKIDLTADDSDVYIYGGYSEPYMELINFQSGSYRMTTTNRIITVDTTIDLSSIIRFWESGFSFRGLRNYLRRSDSGADAAKRINIYLPSDGDINIVNVTLGSGSVYVSNFDTSIDINVDIGTGDATFTSFSTSSMVSIDIGTGGVYMRDVSIGTFDVLISDGDITAENFTSGSINISGNETSVSLKITPDTPEFSMNLSARHGSITLFGENSGREYSREVTTTSARAIITVSSGDILIEYGESRQPTVSGVETDAETGGETGPAETNENE